MLRAVIVDDEALARERLARMLAGFSDRIEVTGEAADGIEALELLRQTRPDVVFLDIRMPGLDGFALLEKLEKIPAVIFTTAYDAYALKAFDEDAADYLLKPVEAGRLARAIEKVERLVEGESDALRRRLQGLLENIGRAPLQQLTVRSGDRVFFINYDDICFFEASDKLVSLFTAEESYVCDLSLNELEKRLPGESFRRVHRSVLVNIRHIREAQRWFGGRYRLVMNDNRRSTLPVSRGLKKNIGL
ncbi:MAG TPA: response regulator transcription factor [Caldithrix abyssi]|uniref:Response regulator transcription factor n=1 Tax=Caldithrix abyssi TaxID=187145 RepID=A0A7V5VES3_CALAY|nr:response regulator transcription factor [Caldithrix abyssi]